MFAEELSSNASRKRQQENRARRRQLKTEQNRKQTEQKADPLKLSLTAAGTVPPSNEMLLVSLKSTREDSGAKAATSLCLSEPTEVSIAPTTGKPSAVANALQQRHLRQLTQQQQQSCIKIQAFLRMCLSNQNLLDQTHATIVRNLSSLKTLRNFLKKKSPESPFVPPTATTAAFVLQLLFLTKAFPYKRKRKTGENCVFPARHIQIRSREVASTIMKEILEYTVIPGIKFTKDDNMNPFLSWLGTDYGKHRLEHLLKLCLHVSMMKNAHVPTVLAASSVFDLSLGLDSKNSPSKKSQAVITPCCQAWLLHAESTHASQAVSEKSLSLTGSMDLITNLRKFLLFGIGDSPIPASSQSDREQCISESERMHADILFQLVLRAVQSVPEESVAVLQARFLSEILTIPLVTWKVSATCIAHLLSPNHGKDSFLISMISSFIELNKESLSSGEMGSALPVVNLPLTQCPSINTQCLLANLVSIGKICPQLNGSDRNNIDFLSATIFFNFVASILDVVPLGTFASRDSAVEWVTDGKGHHTPIVLSPVILNQCRLLLVESFVRNLFRCAIDTDALRTEEILAAKTDTDMKHEADLKQAGTATAASMAADEARVDRNRAWLSSKWASKLKKSVANLLSKDESVARRNNCGPGMLTETSSVSLKLARGAKDVTATKAYEASKKGPPSEGNKVTLNASPYSPCLLFALCSVYSVFLSRWGGDGMEDIVNCPVQKGNVQIATSRPDPCALALLNVLCFGTDIIKTTWCLLQGDKEILSNVGALIDKQRGALPLKSLTARPSYIVTKSRDGRTQYDGAVILFVCLATLSHSLLITDDTELFEIGKPLPIHQLRRCIILLKRVIIRACIIDRDSNGARTHPFGLALVSTSVKVCRDLYDRSSRRPLCVPKLWLVDNLMVKEIQNCKSHAEYAALLSTPVLRICPFLVSFKRRLKLFERIVTTSRIDIQGVNDANPFNTNPLKPGIPVQIMRGRVLEDGLATLNKLGRNLRQRINVQYLNEAGARESGVDAGGLFKEFWTDLCAVAFNPNYALFRVTEDGQNCLYPNPSSAAAHGTETHIVLFEFLGRILGKALYESISIQPQLCHATLSYLKGDYNYMHMLPDLSSIDSQLYNNLMFLKTYDGDAEDLCLTFAVVVDDFGGNKQIELMPNGANIVVTNANKYRYIGMAAKHYVVDRVKEQSEAFTRGLWDVIDKSWLQLFNEPELQVLISGATGDSIDVDDMRANTRYVGGYTGLERIISRFWKVVASFSTKQQGDLLRFVTSCERAPPLGFASMNPPFTIQRVGIMRDGDLLPTASTCFNTLKLPTYSSEKILKERLLYAIESGAGFELT